MYHELVITPIEPDGRRLFSTVLVLSEDDIERPDFGPLLRQYIVDWPEQIQWVNELFSDVDQSDLVAPVANVDVAA